MAKLAYSEKLGRKIRQDMPKELGKSTQELAEEAIRDGRASEAIELVDYMREEFLIIHDFMVAWTHDLLGFIASRIGEDAVPEAIRVTYDKLWKERYRFWDQMTPEEKLQLSVEGWRGHFSGPGRRGDLIVEEEPDRYIIRADPCGSGGVLRRGESVVKAPAITPDGVTKQPHDWTWGKTGVHWYCTHCPIVLEWLPAIDYGHPMRPLDHTLDHFAPCVWYIYKSSENIRPEHFTRIGVKPPSDEEHKNCKT